MMPALLTEHACVVVGRSHLVFNVAAFGAGGSFLTHTYNIVTTNKLCGFVAHSVPRQHVIAGKKVYPPINYTSF